MVNVPLSENVFFRAQGGSLSQDGYVRRGTQVLGGSEDTLVRLQLAVEPSDALRVTFGLSSTQSESDGNPQDLATFDMTSEPELRRPTARLGLRLPASGRPAAHRSEQRSAHRARRLYDAGLVLPR